MKKYIFITIFILSLLFVILTPLMFKKSVSIIKDKEQIPKMVNKTFLKNKNDNKISEDFFKFEVTDSENIIINEALSSPKNVEIINIGTSQQRLTLAWDKIANDDLLGSFITYKIYRKVGFEGKFMPISTEDKISFNESINKYTFSDPVVSFQDEVSQWNPLQYYSYVVSSSLVSDNSESSPSNIVLGYIIPNTPLNALKDIWKTLEVSNMNTYGFSAFGGSSEYKVGKNSGYFKRTQKMHNSEKFVYDYNQFSEFGTITIDGILQGKLTDDFSVSINGLLKITGIYEAELEFVNFSVSSTTGSANGGFLIIDYQNQKKEISFSNPVLDTLIRG